GRHSLDDRVAGLRGPALDCLTLHTVSHRVSALNTETSRRFAGDLCGPPPACSMFGIRFAPPYPGLRTARPGSLNEEMNMSTQTPTVTGADRIDTSLPFVQAMARRMASSMPHSIDVADLVQDGMIGLIDAADRYDESRGIKFETFAERRVRGAMIDALRRDAWPRGVRRQRREIEAAREKLRHELGCEPSLADLAAHLGSDEATLGRQITRISTIEATSPLASPDDVEAANLPPVMVPSEPAAPDREYEQHEAQDRVRAAIAALPARERKVVRMYYFGESTMREIGLEIGVNESRVSQLHARAVRRLRKLLGADDFPAVAAAA
ncbi:MAG: FliA/WhiG family RNA polymerase sigma factor, partial [Gemmatimonadota bacterium]|nr:FliA/WhiG family RNA polymerase sigma factor [Gemmatimonadota bacterium]